MSSGNKYNAGPATPDNPQGIRVVETAPAVRPQAIMQIVLLSNGQVQVGYQGEASSFLIEGMLGVARTELYAQLAKKSQGPAIELAPPGLKIA